MIGNSQTIPLLDRKAAAVDWAEPCEAQQITLALNRSDKRAPCRRYFQSILTRKHKAKVPALHTVETASKDVYPKRMDLLQTLGFDMDPDHAIPALPQDIDEFACRDAVEISAEPQIQFVFVSGCRYFEILCHGLAPPILSVVPRAFLAGNALAVSVQRPFLSSSTG
jgi:hypothetical protein